MTEILAGAPGVLVGRSVIVRLRLNDWNKMTEVKAQVTIINRTPYLERIFIFRK